SGARTSWSSTTSGSRSASQAGMPLRHAARIPLTLTVAMVSTRPIQPSPADAPGLPMRPDSRRARARSREGALGGLDDVAQEHRARHGPDPARVGRDPARDLALPGVDVPDDARLARLGVRRPRHTDVDDDGARLAHARAGDPRDARGR